jgi:phosphoglycerol transferase MdoB-like AlkP superfamily enzyme
MTFWMQRWLPGRLRLVATLALSFLAVNASVRVGLAVFNGAWDLLAPWRLVPMMLIGTGFDVAAATFFLAPIGLLILAWPQDRRGLRTAVGTLLLPICVGLVFVGASEFTFWNEFASRFNFIAVDYLIYTNEVVGNLRESYNLTLLLSVVAGVSLTLWWAVMRAMKPHWSAPTPKRARWIGAAALTLAPLLAVGVVDARFKEFSNDAQANELAGNGYFDFWHAFWHNQIDYARFYKTIPREQAVAELAKAWPREKDNTTKELSSATSDFKTRPNERHISHSGQTENRMNVVMVSVESLSAEFMTAFAPPGRPTLTPAMDRLAHEGLLFTQLYATGTRTVRGLEALSLSVPPTPGHAIVKRPNNGGLFTLGEVFRSKGYEPLYLYGGYGYFDNMNTFFAGNGYTVVDRRALAPADIHFENIWGVADEDLFTLALRELDTRDQAGKPFFAHVMTTSNHRPFTYPEGRIDIASKTGRDGGVKYTDWAIGNFMDQARKKPWFDNTLFVIVADHTHKGRGRQELPPENYHIPMVILAPKHIQPGRVNTLASQIDVAPTILGLLNFNYESKFYGHDILREGREHPRALLANYQTVGYYEQGRVVELKPNQRTRVVMASDGSLAPNDALSASLTAEAISYYQLASEAYGDGAMASSAAPVAQPMPAAPSRSQ